MKRFLGIVCINFAVLALGLIAVELVFGGWIKEDPFRRLHVPTSIDRHYKLEGLYPGPDAIRYTRDEYGLRGDYPSPDAIDILTVGGSTTDQAYIGDGETWQDYMAKEFGRHGYEVDVVNAGLDGNTTYGHLKCFEWWYPRIPGFKPKCILYYVGINDVYADSPKYADTGFRGLLAEKSVLYRFLRIIKGVLLAHKYDIGHSRTDFQHVEWVEDRLAAPSRYREAFADSLAGYEQRIRRLIDETGKLGAVPVFVTQQTRLNRFEDGHLVGVAIRFEFKGYAFNGVDRYYILEMFNDVVRRVCRETGTMCIDLAKDLTFRDEDFYDWMHNTPSGAKKIGRYLADTVMSSPELMKKLSR